MNIEYYFPEPAWETIKSYFLVKNRVTRTAKLLKHAFESYERLYERIDKDINPYPTFSSYYFLCYMQYRRHFNYNKYMNRRVGNDGSPIY